MAEMKIGFCKASMHNLPEICSQMVTGYITKEANTVGEGKSDNQTKTSKQSKDIDLRVDFVQIRKAADICEVHAVVFPAAAGGSADAHVPVNIKLNTKINEIVEATCEQCTQKGSCPHMLTFIFWLYRKSVDIEEPAINSFWGSESESLSDEGPAEAMRIRDLFVYDEMRLENDLEAAACTEDEGNAFLEAVLDGLDELGLRDSALFRHCRLVTDEFEPLFVHHALLNASNNYVKDMRSFTLHMEDQAKQGLFTRLAEVSKNCYKSPLWLEAQYMRLRCSLFHRIVSRKDPLDDQQILSSLFCKGREHNAEERQKLKQHKRFILKQTEKLENKSYTDCGLILSESYPYICASPDGITDDHIVEIKVPKTDDEFEKYLEGREIITPKYMAQIQIQMYMANVTKALYCVLSPTFDTNGALHYVWVKADMEFVASLLGAAEDFWKDVVFPQLSRIYLCSQ